MPDHLESGDFELGAGWSEADELAAYRMMLQIRRFEEKAAQLYAMGHILNLERLSIGQEAVATGLTMAAQAIDTMIVGARPHGVLLARGLDPQHLMASLLRNKATALPGPPATHLAPRLTEKSTDLELLLIEVSKAGAAGQVAVWCVGDGDDDGGRVLELIQDVAASRLPVIFVIENTSSRASSGSVCSTAASSLSKNCAAAGIRTALASGLDVRKVRTAAAEAFASVRSGQGAFVLEIMTYRYHGHTGGYAASGARPREETDPVAKARARITLNGGATAEQRLLDIEHAVRADVNAALNTARAALSAA